MCPPIEKVLTQPKIGDDNIGNTAAFKMGNGIIWTRTRSNRILEALSYNGPFEVILFNSYMMSGFQLLYPKQGVS